ncbi:MAG TPA: polysaccharide biosynthesis protein [Chitinophagaceae bacterium]|nr:polysaccharide biosynthesis protein [Chitinophagaceae bacterium]HAN37978.1 polysaccharide biosynthesis protein [Chitinophagaceae bacterium]
MKQLHNLLSQNRIAPRWFIFLLDIIICNLSLVYANYLRFNFNFDILAEKHIISEVIIITTVNAIFFVTFRTYEGIIRFSGVKEALRTASAIFYSFFLISVVNIISRFFGGTDLVPMSILIIYFFTASFLVFGYRFLVKNLYAQSLRNKSSNNVIIFGGELNGSMLKRTIEQNGKNNYNVVAFVDDDEKFVGKSIDGVKIYTFDQIREVVDTWKVNNLFFAKQDFDLKLKNAIVDFCLEKNIKVKNLPPVTEWIHGQLNLQRVEEVKIEDLLNRPAIQLANTHVNNYLKSRRVLITGAAGSIGSEIARQVAAIYPQAIIICDQNESGLFELEYEINHKYGYQSEMAVFIGDIRDKKAMQHLFAVYKPDVIFHAAAYKHVPLMEQHPCEAIKNNVLGTMLLADLAEKYHAERFVMVSTDKAINPTNVMGASKRIAEMYVQALQHRDLPYYVTPAGSIHEKPLEYRNPRRTKFITTRFGNVLGSNGSVIPRFKQQIQKGGPVTVTHPDIIRYFMTIPEACNLVLEAGTMGNGGEVFLFDMGEPVKIVDLAKKMIRLAGYMPERDIKIEFTGLRPGEKLFEELLNKEEEVIPTHHKKILIAKVAEQVYESLKQQIDDLIFLANANNDDEVVRLMKKIVPEYKSKNSVYESFDTQKPSSSKPANIN